jgi:pyrroline-5-carboxylate reductase
LIEIKEEAHLQILWTLTGLIAPFYDLVEKLSHWSQEQGVEARIADKYAMELFSALTSYTRKNMPVNYARLKNEATTPGGMNDQALNIISQLGANKVYVAAAQAIFQRFKN